MLILPSFVSLPLPPRGGFIVVFLFTEREFFFAKKIILFLNYINKYLCCCRLGIEIYIRFFIISYGAISGSRGMLLYEWDAILACEKPAATFSKNV